jgi:hypothetical protein
MTMAVNNDTKIPTTYVPGPTGSDIGTKPVDGAQADTGVEERQPPPPPPPNNPQDTEDHSVTAPSSAGVSTYDHRDPSTWDTATWMKKLKEDPYKYGRLFTEMATAGTLSTDAKENPTLPQFATNLLQDFFRNQSLIMNMSNMLHDIARAMIDKIRA